MCKLCWALVATLTIAIAALGYKFIIAGSTAPAASGRTAIIMNAGEREFVLAEMRAFLVSVQDITQGLSDNDMKQVAEAAKTSGHSAVHGAPGTLMGKLPIEFKKLGMDTHKKFDQLAREAAEIGDKDLLLKNLGILMQNCTACHASYEIQLAE